ncbi:hypothetical protein HNV12_24690 [Methanococcoides sp. SA1]|nr:hypothetical protein [Methanococcoides sp. SA1]
MNQKTVVPVIHEFGAYLLVPDLDLYHSVINYYENKVEDSYNHYITDRHGRKFKFWSKQGGLRNPKTNELAFEYIFSWKDAIGASKCHIVIKPLFGPGTKTKNGNTFNLPEIATNIDVQCSYFEFHEIIDIYEDILKAIDATRFEHSIARDRSRIFRMARHIRYHERHEADVVNMLKAIKNESSMRGDVDLVEKVRSGKYDMYKIDLPSFDVCNIETEFVHSVKSYRIKNFLERTVSDPLKHPKLEVFFNSKEHNRIYGKYPTIDEFLQIEKDLDRLLASLLNFVGPIE